jgi:NAD(P)-dependent dehydrogenase (short-subunit alcohol dehydrogenase family)
MGRPHRHADRYWSGMMVARGSVVVTGASTGIGWGCVKVLTAAGFHVFGSVRKQADADRLTAEFGAHVTPLLFDVTDQVAVANAARTVEQALGGKTLAGLVNNAGIAVAGPLLYLNIEEVEKQFAVNVTGPLIVTQAFAPLLGADRTRQGAPGRIVMISSVGGRNALPFAGPYAASKFAVEGLSEALRRELMLFGIDVVIVAPGAVVTPIWDKTEVAIEPFANTPYAAALAKMKTVMLDSAAKGLPPEKIGEAVLTGLTAAKPRTRYTVAPNPVQQIMFRMLPKRLVDRMIGGRIGLIPQR